MNLMEAITMSKLILMCLSAIYERKKPNFLFLLLKPKQIFDEKTTKTVTQTVLQH